MKPGRNINGLPSELICKIFSLAICPQDAKKDRCILSLVCRLWRDYVEGSALLWADISALGGQAYMRRALEKSQTSLINLHYPRFCELPVDLKLFLAEAGPHIARWRSLSVMCRSSPKPWRSTLGPLTTSQAPSLESLELNLAGAPHTIPQNAITLFGGAPAPSTLKRLTLQRVHVAFEHLSPSGLISLDLTKTANISTLQLLEILRNSPWLETLSLNENPGLVGIGSRSSAIPSIELPKLNSLALEWTDPEGANCILSKIRIPNRRRVYICDGSSELDARASLLTPTITHILHTTLPAPDPLFSDIRVDVEGTDECKIQFRGMELHLAINGEDQIHDVLGWLVEGLGSEAAACPVRMILDKSAMDPLRLAAVPTPLVVKHLSIHGREAAFLQSSCDTTLGSPGSTFSGWPFAKMESLSVELDNIASEVELTCMLSSRYGETASGNETESRGPARLRSVELRRESMVEGLMEKIMEILGEADVFWTEE